jgi:hypothetical protein
MGVLHMTKHRNGPPFVTIAILGPNLANETGLMAKVG